MIVLVFAPQFWVNFCRYDMSHEYWACHKDELLQTGGGINHTQLRER